MELKTLLCRLGTLIILSERQICANGEIEEALSNFRILPGILPE
jgi:hypothetical protein